MIKINNTIFVYVQNNNTAILEFPDYNIKTTAYIGINGVTSHKTEGDGCTPLGTFNLGFLLGTHPISEVKNNTNLKYKQITENMYLVDDYRSKYYNKLVNITNVQPDWNSAEHLTNFPIQYEYLIEIKTNPNNIPKNGSAVFLHCSNNKPTKGCIAIDKNIMEALISIINKDTKISIINIQ